MASGINEHKANVVCDEEVPDWVLAKRGIKLLINNNAREAQELFSRYPDNITMCAGYSFAAFMVIFVCCGDGRGKKSHYWRS